MALFGNGIRVPIVEALLRKTNENKNGPEAKNFVVFKRKIFLKCGEF